MGPLDPSQNKALFKKRIYRPWNAPLEASLQVPATEEKMVLADQLPTSSTNRGQDNQEPLTLQRSSAKATEAVLIGGFFYPKQNAGAPLESGAINNLMQELKSKEQEILLLDHDLQVTRALEEARKAEASQAHEVHARKSAEENALFAIQKAKLAAEQAHKAESQVLAEKQLRLELERTKKALEERLQDALKTLEKEETSRKSVEEKLMIVKTQMDNRIASIQKETEKKIQENQEQITMHEKAKLMAQSFTQKTMETVRQTEAARLALEEELAAFQKKYEAQLEKARMIEVQQQTMKDNNTLASNLLAQALERAKNLEAIVEIEKELRKQCEQKMTDAYIRAEEAKRKLSEDRIILMEQEITALESEKSKIEDKLFKTQRSIRNLEIMRLASD